MNATSKKLGFYLGLSLLIINVCIYILLIPYLRRLSNVDLIGSSLSTVILALCYPIVVILEKFMFELLALSRIAKDIIALLVVPSVYGLFACYLDKWIISRLFNKVWLRVLLILVLFIIISIPFLIKYPVLETIA